MVYLSCPLFLGCPLLICFKLFAVPPYRNPFNFAFSSDAAFVSSAACAQVIETEDTLSAAHLGELNLFFLARLKTDRSSGRDVEVIAVCFFPVKGEAPVDLKEMKMGADLNGTVLPY